MTQIRRLFYLVTILAIVLPVGLLSQDVAANASTTGPLIVGNSAAIGNGPISTFDYGAGTQLGSFVPDAASGAGNNNGRAVDVNGNDVFYTELTDVFGPSDAIHVAPFNGGAGGSDTRTIPNPRPDVGIQDLELSQGILYALTGYPNSSPIVYGLDPSDGAILRGPIPLASPAYGDSDGFTILPNGNFLINSGDASCFYSQFDPTTGTATGDTFFVPESDCTGVDTDGTSLYFSTNFNSLTQTDLNGNEISQQPLGSNIEDISVAGPIEVELAGFGDSIAAGHGLGADDNPSAYPTVVGTFFGFGTKNYAVSGACVTTAGSTTLFKADSRTPSGCPSGVAEQVQRAIDEGVKPKVVTLTVGADDIRFADCFRFMLGLSQLSGSATDPCSGTTFSAHIAAFKNNLAQLISRIHAAFPDAKLAITYLYNPLPIPDQETSSTCGLAFDIGYIAQSPSSHLYQLAVKPKDFSKGVQKYASDVYNHAEDVVQTVNSAIDAVASAPFIRIADVSGFSGHDLCGQYGVYQPYLFGPKIQATVTVHFSNLHSQTFHKDAIPSEDCATYCQQHDQNGTISGTNKKLFDHVTADYSVVWHVDGAPHPDEAGQAELALDVVIALL